MRPALTLALTVSGLLLMAILSLGSPAQSEAGSLVVTTTADSGPGSFRKALADAGTTPGLDVITFDAGVFPEASPATIHSTENYVIEGDAASQPLTIDGTGAGVILDLSTANAGDAAIHFRASGPVSGITLKHFTIENFTSSDPSEGNGVEIGFQTTSISDVLIEDLTVKDNQRTGILLGAGTSMTHVVIRASEISGNGHAGVALSAASMDNVMVENNNIRQNTWAGVEVEAESSPSPATVSVTENDISHNGRDGVFVTGNESNPTSHVTINRNNTTANGGLGINLDAGTQDSFGVTANDPGDADTGPNNLLNFPVLNGVGPAGIVGSACGNCTVELFIADSDSSGHGEGAGYFTTGTADVDGHFNISGCGQNAGANVTATATDANGNTSEFAQNYVLPTKPPCPPKNGDLDCDGDVDGRDALVAIIDNAGATQLSREPGCPELGSSLAQPASAATGPAVFGDVNCDTDVGAGDAITILQHVAEVTLAPTPPAGCVPVGDPLPR